MSDIKDKLAALLAQKAVVTGAEWRRRLEDLARRRAEGEFEIDKTIPGRLVGDADSAFHLVQHDIPLDTVHGALPFSALFTAIPEHIAFSACDPDLEEWDPAKTVFLDVETTGLAGGTGTVAFLVGAAYVVKDVLRLDQCFMRDFDDEAPMLEYLRDVFAPAETVVSYNGKSFDVPLLRTRFIQNRIRCPLDRARHLDLLHAARRLWKARLQDCSLTNVESAVLGIERQGDIPSEEIPQLWLDYLRTRDARDLVRVFYHHKMDVLSLVTLTVHLSHCMSAAAASGLEHAEDQLSLVRLLFRQRRYERVIELGRRFLETDTEPALRRECLEFMGFAHKRLGDWTAMEDAWTVLLREFPDSAVAHLELAKHFEHRTRNLSEAERLCTAMIQYFDTRCALRNDGFDAGRRAAFQFRLDRIRRKLERATGRFVE